MLVKTKNDPLLLLILCHMNNSDQTSPYFILVGRIFSKEKNIFFIFFTYFINLKYNVKDTLRVYLFMIIILFLL